MSSPSNVLRNYVSGNTLKAKLDVWGFLRVPLSHYTTLWHYRLPLWEEEGFLPSSPKPFSHAKIVPREELFLYFCYCACTEYSQVESKRGGGGILAQENGWEREGRGLPLWQPSKLKWGSLIFVHSRSLQLLCGRGEPRPSSSKALCRLALQRGGGALHWQTSKRLTF